MISKSNKLLTLITLPLLPYIFPNLLTIVVQMQNKAISKDITRQTVPILKKPFPIPSLGPRKRSSLSHNKSMMAEPIISHTRSIHFCL